MQFLTRSPSARLDVLIVGAGPAGLGCAVALKACGVDNLAILDRSGVGAAFERWPAQMAAMAWLRIAHRGPWRAGRARKPS